MKIYFVLLLLLPTSLFAGIVIPEVSDEIDPEMTYVFYLHGRIVQEQGLRPTHPRYGLYDYPAILEAIGQGGVTVISERRAKGTETDDYARYTAGQVEQLLAAGVEPGHITVVGFSAGGVIAITTSSILADTDIKFVILASCWGWTKQLPDLRLNGRILSIYEETDMALSCGDLAERDPGPAVFSEIAINTGKQHGAFFLPRDEWIKPVLDWIQSR